MITLLASIEKE